MENLTGIWRFTQQWQGAEPYSFEAEFTADGKISINGNQYFGTYSILFSTPFISLAIADFQGQSVTAYSGELRGLTMNGLTVGTSVQGATHNGRWSAQLISRGENTGFNVPK